MDKKKLVKFNKRFINNLAISNLVLAVEETVF